MRPLCLSHGGHRFVVALQTSRRFSTDAPPHEEVTKAFKTLGSTQGTQFADLKKRYLHLAKEHHPDVSSSSAKSSTVQMSSINEAFDVLSRANKAGTLPKAGGSSASSGARTATPHGFSGFQNGFPESGYQPIWEDMPPEFYESMWSEMQEDFQQNRKKWDASKAYGMDESDFPYHNHQNQGRRGGEGRKPPQYERKKQQEPQQAQTTTTWKSSDLDALQNMYQDGRSFEFIANALGKKKDEVVDEFNRWCNDQNSVRNNRGRGGNRGRGRGGRGRPENMYASMDYDDIADAFYDSEAFDEFGEPLEVQFFTDMDDVHPFMGKHSMHRGGRGGNNNRGRHGPPRNTQNHFHKGGKPRYQR
ncbi:DNA-J protein, putative [Bodo saltans]|uniref:DNA-J protein, putative n=1 Tax=Bodo saltans TaxID=75058 RepID=A0A0S4J8K6_BODSA|nr:DNA-J protein, putative [Bodo saltans]|eukprot:CUG87832.1 DNA-J protein, putative [Bodo saltans]